MVIRRTELARRLEKPVFATVVVIVRLPPCHPCLAVFRRYASVASSFPSVPVKRCAFGLPSHHESQAEFEDDIPLGVNGPIETVIQAMRHFHQ